MTKLILFALTLTAPLGHALATLETRGARLCAAERCYDRLPLAPGGLDLFDQLSQYEMHFDADFTPKHGETITFARLLAVAGALGLSDDGRARVLKDFSRLKLTDLGVNITPTAPGDAEKALEVPFVARLEWADRGTPDGITVIRGRLVLPRDREIDVNQPAGDLNKQLSALIRIDEASRATPTTTQIVEIVAPAVLGNLVLAYLSPAAQLEGTPLEALGQFFSVPQ